MLRRVIKQLKPRRQTVELRPSRIRRDPVRLASPVQPKPESPEREAWSTVTGVVLFALAGTVLIVGIGSATAWMSGAAAEAPRPQFGQCYNEYGPNCVLDGDTIYLGGQKLQIAGMDAPEIQGAQCEDERSRGIAAAVKLAELLNGGKVTMAGAEREPDGQIRRKIQVDGVDVGPAMVDAGMARDPGSGQSWC
jgi:micrococcal nuclease